MSDLTRLRLISNMLALLTVLVTAVLLFCEFDPQYYLAGCIFAAVHFHLQAVHLSNRQYGSEENPSEPFLSSDELMAGSILPIFFNIILGGMVRAQLPGDNIRLESLFSLAAWLGMAAAYLSGPLMWLYTVRHYRAKRAKGKRKHAETVTVDELLGQQVTVVVESPMYEPPPRREAQRFTTYD